MWIDPITSLLVVAALAAGPPAGSMSADLPAAAPFAGVPLTAVWSALACSATASAGPARSAPSESTRFERMAESPPGVPYYEIDLVTTKNLPGTARAGGTGHVAYARSPFGVALAADGSYRYDVELRLTDMERPGRGKLIAWVTTPQVDKVRRLGAFDDELGVRGDVSWNKFLVVVTLEDADDPAAKTWSGPIVLRGMSRSGMMHTMAGHGPFQQELCAKYGY